MYSDQERFNFRVISILKTINAQSGTSLIELYNPNWKPVTVDEDADYSAFITFLTATINIKSIGEVDIPPIPESALPEDVQKILDEVASLANYKTLQLMSGFEGESPQELCTVPVFNQSPFYRISLMPYWSGTNNTLDVGTNINGAGEVLYLQMINSLQGSDRIIIRGSAIRRASKPIQSTQQIIYQSYQRTVNFTESVVLAANARRDSATFVNYTDPPLFDPVTSLPANPADYICWVKRGNGNGLPVSARGGVYQINDLNQYKGEVRAYSVKPVLLAVEEGVKQ